MRLISLELNGFRRFAESSKINVDCKLVAVVGPNEAGKTSLLEALESLNHKTPVRTDGPQQQTTRGLDLAPGHVLLTATYLLEEIDWEGVDLDVEARPRWLVARKRVDGKVTYSLHPEITRSRSHRTTLAARLRKLHAVLQDDHAVVGTLEQAIEAITSDTEFLSTEQIDLLTALATSARSALSFTQADPEIAGALQRVVDLESREPPSVEMMRILEPHIPKCVRFSDADRHLESAYSIDAYFRENQPQRIPAALQNLAAAANLNLQTLYSARLAKDEGKIETLIAAANKALEELMFKQWSQSKITARLRLDQLRLHILVGSLDDAYVAIAERSDGLRQFVALLAFLSREPRTRDPILLIDEVERHLHYDAQADLVQMFARQTVAPKVVYTTHSIGCLPEDLGSGVRLVAIDNHRSRFVNAFWENDQPGFSELLFGMGASTLAFIPVRFAVLTEGAADMLLLPPLLREATGRDYLDYQIAPGLAIASEDQIAMIDREARRTAYLVDGDEAGASIRSKLRRAGVPDDRIIALPSLNGAGSVVEDLLDGHAYCAAVNEELRRSHGKGSLVDANSCVGPNRPNRIRKLCSDAGVPPPSKTSVAYRVIENRHEQPMLKAEAKDDLVRLNDQIRKVLGLNT